MKINSFFGISLALLFLTNVLQGNELFIRFDESCMDEFEYVYQNQNLGNNDHLTYAINVGQGRKIFLEVGEPVQRTFPQQTINCSNAFFDQQLVDAINQKIDQVFVITVRGNRYFAAPVTMAAYYEKSGNVITYNAPKYGFRFNLAEGAGGVNVGYGVRGAQVTFEGMLDNECSGALAFRQIKNDSDYNDIISDIVFVPEVGVVEERIGYDVDDAIRNTKRLEKVNGKKLERYMQELCSGKPLSSITPGNTATPYYQPQPIPDQPQQPIQDYNYNDATYVAPKGYQQTTPVASSVEYHTVKKGETLYRIAKNYGISIAQLRDWNGLQETNLIYKGDRLQVSGGVVRSQENVANYETIQASGNSALTAKTPASTASTSSDKYHFVRFGETVASIALNYGLTEQKLREINNLSSNEFVKVNQKLKVSDCNCPPTQNAASYGQQPTNTTANTNYPTYPQPYNSAGPVLSSKSPEAPQSFNQELRNTPQFYQSQQPFNNQKIEPIRPDNFNTSPSSNQTYNRAADPYGGSQNQSAVPVFPAPDDEVVPQSYEFVPQYNKRSVGDRKTHIVKDGEDLYKISQMYNTNVQRLLELNNMRQNEVLIPYQRIYVQ